MLTLCLGQCRASRGLTLRFSQCQMALCTIRCSPTVHVNRAAVDNMQQYISIASLHRIYGNVVRVGGVDGQARRDGNEIMSAVQTSSPEAPDCATLEFFRSRAAVHHLTPGGIRALQRVRAASSLNVSQHCRCSALPDPTARANFMGDLQGTITCTMRSSVR